MTSITNLSPLLRMGSLVLGVLVIATVAVAILRRARPGKDFSELSARVRAWWIMSAVFFAAIVVSNRVSLVFFALMSFWAMKEYVTLLKTRPADHRALVLTFLAVPVQYIWIGLDPPWYGMFIIFIPVYMLLVLPVRMVVAALVGALIGGSVMYVFGMREPWFAHVFLDRVPGIYSALIARVDGQIEQMGLVAVLLGPVKGIPYKIYAVEWAARGGSFLAFMLISIPARYVRFLVTALVARGIARLLEPFTHHRAIVEISILTVLWLTFYALYFTRSGW